MQVDLYHKSVSITPSSLPPALPPFWPGYTPSLPLMIKSVAMPLNIAKMKKKKKKGLLVKQKVTQELF